MQQQTATRPQFTDDASALDDAFAGAAFGGAGQLNALVPIDKGDVMVQTQGAIITAQKVVVERNMAKVKARIQALANAAGDRYYYRIPFKNKKKNRTEYVEGATVKCTNDVAREYGNCLVDTRVMSEGEHWTFYGRFVDLETGYSLTRPFQQRKRQNVGEGMDAGRQLDIIFQIGASKAARNVVANALETLVDFAFQEAKKGLLDRVQKNPDGAKEWIMSNLGEFNIGVARVEAIYGRKAAHWTVHDMAKIFAELRGILDGMAIAEEVYPQVEAQTGNAEPRADAGGGVGTGGQQENPGADAGAGAQGGSAPPAEGGAGTGSAPPSAAETQTGSTGQAEAQRKPRSAADIAAKHVKPAADQKPAAPSLFSED